MSKKAQKIVLVGLVFSLTLFIVGMIAAMCQLKIDAAKASEAQMKERTVTETSEKKESVELGEALRTETINAVFEKEAIPAYSSAELMELDMSKPSGATVADLKLVTVGGLVGLEEAFWQTEQDYNINCLFVMAIAAHESANGTNCFLPNNMFGYGGISFDSKEECIDTVAKNLASAYLSKEGSLYSGKTISSVNKRYAASTAWDDRVANHMAAYYSIISENHNKALDKLK